MVEKTGLQVIVLTLAYGLCSSLLLLINKVRFWYAMIAINISKHNVQHIQCRLQVMPISVLTELLLNLTCKQQT